jgi:galactoside O-acetyltransferase
MSRLKFIFSEIRGSWRYIISFFPGHAGVLLRSRLFKKIVRSSGSHIRIGIGVEITGSENITVGDNVSIMKFSSLYAQQGRIEMGSNISINSNTCIGADGGTIEIGDNVIIAQNVVLRASDHRYSSIDVPIREQGHVGGKIVVENDVWIAANATITRDVRIGAHSVIAAGAVVTKDIEPYSVCGGIPATLIKKRDS